MKGKIDSVALMRKLRDRISKRFRKMTFEEQKHYLKQANKQKINKKTSESKVHLG